MTRTIQILRGTEAQNDAFTGAIGELTMDTTNNQLRLHDGTTAGGHIIGASSYHPDLFTFQWTDHELNDVQWLRADTFSWQSGAVYEAAYNHLVDDLSQFVQSWTWSGSINLFTASRYPQVGDSAYLNPQLTGSGYEIISVTDTTITTAGYTCNISSSITMSEAAQTETISGITISFYTAADGHKIVLPGQESNVAAIYAATGVAWYYIIDTANQRFKLPRINATKENIINSYQVITGAIHGNAGGTLKWMSDTSDNINGSAGAYIRINNASTETANMGNVQPTLSTNIRPNNLYADRDSSDSYFSGAKYLYFYVGSFTQTAIENTAGLNAELFNSKADVSTVAHVVTEFQAPTAQNNYTWYRLYADGWVEQGGQFGGDGAGSITKTLPIEMADTNYEVIVSANVSDGTFFGAAYKNSTTQITIWTTNYLGGMTRQAGSHWRVSGMAA